MPVSKSFDAPDGTFHYLDWGGTGPAAHFSHATGLCAGVYTPLIGELTGRLHLIGMDDRGHGRTKAAADPKQLKSWNTFASDLEFFFERLDGPLIGIGHSRGAVASLLLAVRRPDLISALVLIDPTILPLSWMWWWYLAKKTGAARWVPIAATAARRRYRWPSRESILENYRRKAVFRSWQEGFLEAYIDYGTEPAEDGGIQLCCRPAWEARAFATCNHDVWRYIQRIEQPTLLLFGAGSDICLPAAVKRFVRCVPHAEVRAFERTSHFVPMERPREVAAAINTFLDRSGVSTNSKPDEL
jgi:pimeloyl-ACP methyl ester carboxylesterase